MVDKNPDEQAPEKQPPRPKLTADQTSENDPPSAGSNPINVPDNPTEEDPIVLPASGLAGFDREAGRIPSVNVPRTDAEVIVVYDEAAQGSAAAASTTTTGRLPEDKDEPEGSK